MARSGRKGPWRETEEVAEGYYLMHADYPGGRRETDPTVEEVYAVLGRLSPTLFLDVLNSLKGARAEFESFSGEYEELITKLEGEEREKAEEEGARSG